MLRIDLRRGHVGLHVEYELNLRSQARANEVTHFPYKRRDVDRSGVQGLPPRKGEQALYKRFCPLSRLQRSIDELKLSPVSRATAIEQIEAAG
ncbi:hypothetical protein RSO01_70690 [Reyranella soli]|uniref:Uncharacterized protein n=1 Tax=Reyranella soli TaxID=1230389 RepID=A0A512NLT1_9HYPH|nr:hypothetical protein RSO01_70690 [Reyranella soli]